MFSGRRGTQIAFLIALVIMYFRYVKNTKYGIFRSIAIAILGYFAVVVLMTFGDLRSVSNVSFSVLQELFMENLKGKLFTDLIGEFGGTGISLAYSIQSFPSHASYNYGKTYLFSFLQVFPNIGGLLNRFNTDFMFTKAFPSSIQFALGGSYLGELYYNFGFWGVLFCVFVGYALSMFAIRMDEAMNEEKEISIHNMALILIIPNIFIWVRGYFYSFIRIYFWFLIVFYLIESIRNRIRSNRSSINM